MKSAPLSHGFTLIELVAALAVTGICLAVAVPSFQSLSLNARLSDLAGALVSSLNEARSEAIRRNQTVYACALTQTYDAANQEDRPTCATASVAGQYLWDAGILIYADKAGGQPTHFDDDKGERIHWKLFSQQLTVRLGEQQLAFSAEGRVTNGVGYRFLVHDNATQQCRTIKLSASGRARVCDKGESNCDVC